MKFIIAPHPGDYLFDQRPSNAVALPLVKSGVEPIIHVRHGVSDDAVIVVETEANLVVRYVPRHDAAVDEESDDEPIAAAKGG